MSKYHFEFNQELAYKLRNYNSYSVTLQYCDYVKSYINKIKDKKEHLKAIKAFISVNKTEELYTKVCKLYIESNIKFLKIIFNKLGKKYLKYIIKNYTTYLNVLIKTILRCITIYVL